MTGQPTHRAIVVPPGAQVGGALRHDAVAGGPLPGGASRERPRPRQRVSRDRVPGHAAHAVRVVQHAVAAASGARGGKTLWRGAAHTATLSQQCPMTHLSQDQLEEHQPSGILNRST